MFATSLVLRASPVEFHACLDAIWHVAEERPQLGVRESVPDLPNGSSQLRAVLRLLEGRDPVLHDRPPARDGRPSNSCACAGS